MKRSALFVTLSLCAGLVPLAAQETEAGIQALAVFPQDDLRAAVGGRTGFDVGVHSSIDLTGGSELRPRIDYTRIDGGSFSLSSLSSTTTISGIGVGADFLQFLNDQRRGPYVTGGLDLVWWTTQYRFSSSQREISPTLMLGAGHRFNSAISMEFNLDLGHFRPAVGQAADIRAGLFYQF
jgi:hypothetical protein